MAEEAVLRASIILDVKQAINAYTEARQAHVSMVTALNTGAGALASTGAAVAGVGAGIAAGLLTAVNAASEFERKLDFFSAVSDASVSDMERIRQKALELGADTIYSADQIADSFTDLAKAGVGVDKLLAGIGEAVASLGAATDMPLADAATSLTTILNTFGIEAEEAVSVVDKLAGAANASSIDVQDLIITMTYAGASAKTAGIEFEDVNDAIALLGERGIKGSKAGTGLRQMFDKLLAPTKSGSAALKELGIITEDGTNKLIDMDGGLKPIPALLDTLNGSLEGLTTAEKTDVLGGIFPITSLPTILNLLDGGSDALARLNGEINKTTAAEVASERLDNLAGDVEYLRGEFDTLLINIGATQQALARGLVQALESVVSWLNNLSPEMLGFIVGLAQLAAIGLIVFGVTTMLAGGLLKILSLFLVLRDVLVILQPFLPAIAGGFRLLWAAILGPVGIIIAAITAITGILIWFFTQTEEGRKVWEQISAVFQSTFAAIQPLFADLATAFQALLPALGEAAGALGGAILQALIAISPLIVMVAQVIAGVLAGALTIVVPLLTGLAQLLNGPLGQGLMIAIGIITAIIGVIKIWTAVQWLLNIALTANPIGIIIVAIAALVAAIIWVATQTTFFQDLWANLASFFTTVWTEVSRFFTELWTNLSNFFIGIWEGIVAFFEPILAFIGGFIKFYIEMYINIFLVLAAVFVTIWNFIRDVFVNAWNAIVDFLTPIILWLYNIISTTIQTISDIWNTVWGAISSFFEGIWQGMVDFLVPIILNIYSFISNTLATIQGIWNSIWGAISSFFSGIWNGFIGAVQGPVNTIFGIIGGIQNTVMNFFRGVGSWLLQVGKDLIQGLINGITSMFKGVINAIGNVVNGAIDWAKGVLGIASPSKVFKGIGINTILGMIMGVKNTQPQLERTMSGVASGLDAFYDQVYAAREMDVMMNLESQMGVDAYSATQANQLSLMNEKLAEVMAMPRNQYNIDAEINNPTPETPSESIAKTIRKVSTPGGQK